MCMNPVHKKAMIINNVVRLNAVGFVRCMAFILSREYDRQTIFAFSCIFNPWTRWSVSAPGWDIYIYIYIYIYLFVTSPVGSHSSVTFTSTSENNFCFTNGRAAQRRLALATRRKCASVATARVCTLTLLMGSTRANNPQHFCCERTLTVATWIDRRSPLDRQLRAKKTWLRKKRCYRSFGRESSDSCDGGKN